MPPAPGQGALAITARAGDDKTLALLAPLNIAEHAVTTTAERAFLQALDGSCDRFVLRNWNGIYLHVRKEPT